VRAADARFQGPLFDLAVNPGRRTVRLAAASALMTAHEHVAAEFVSRVTPQLLATRIDVVASRLLLLLALQAEMDQVLKVAEELSTMEKRRVLLLLAIWIVRERDASAAERIARMLPANHAGVKWVLAGAKGTLGDTALDDLGDPISVEQVLLFMGPKKKKKR
jgi:hypothetical protein